MRIGGRIAIGVCLACAAPFSAAGQDRPNGFYLSSPLTISAGYEQNLFTGAGSLDDIATILTLPTFEWIRSTHRAKFYVNYLPEFEMFARNPTLDAWNHQASTRLDYRIDSRNSLEFGDSFLDTKDSSRQLENSLVILPYGQFLQNTFYGEYRYRWNARTKLTFRLDNAVTTADLPAGFGGRLNEVGTAGTATVDQMLTSRQTLSVSYSFLHVTPLSVEGGSATNVNLVIAGYAYQINPTLLLRLNGGGIEGSQSAINGAAVLEKQIGDLWIAGGYQRYLGFYGGLPISGGYLQAATAAFANGVAPVSVYQVLSLRATGQLTRRLKLTAVGEKSLSGADKQGLDGNQNLALRSLIGKLRLSYQLNHRLAFFVAAEHYGQNETEFFNLPVNRNRFFAGFEITLSRRPETQGGSQRRKGGADSDEENKDGQNPGGGWY